jgi:Na+/melibiose symporter-like transporter
MNPKFRSSSVFLLSAFAVMLPYFAFVVYFSLHLPRNHFPSWFTNTIAVWFVANFLALWLLARRMFRRQEAAQSQEVSSNPAKTKFLVWILRIGASYLVIVWSVFFLLGARETIQGKYVLSRAIPAGAFLLLFIGLFGWGVYRSFQRKAKSTRYEG